MEQVQTPSPIPSSSQVGQYVTDIHLFQEDFHVNTCIYPRVWKQDPPLQVATPVEYSTRYKGLEGEVKLKPFRVPKRSSAMWQSFRQEVASLMAGTFQKPCFSRGCIHILDHGRGVFTTNGGWDDFPPAVWHDSPSNGLIKMKMYKQTITRLVKLSNSHFSWWIIMVNCDQTWDFLAIRG